MKRIIILLLFLAVPAFAGWTEPVRISEPGGCLYPQILAQGDTLHVVYSNNEQGWKIGYVRSTDGGDTWSNQQVLSEDSSETVFVRIVENGAKLMVLWRNNDYYSGPRSRNLGYNISNNNGRSWSEPDYILHPNWAHILYFSSSGSGPVVNVILSSRINHELIFFDIRSTDFGRSWSEPAEIFRAAQSSLTDQTQIGDNLHFSWAGRFVWEGGWETFYMRSSDNGATWSDNIMISDDDQVLSKLPSICTDEYGNIALCWWDYKYSPGYWINGDILVKQSLDTGTTWSAEDQVTAEHRAERSDIFWSTDTLHIVWEDWRFGLPTIFYVNSHDSIHDWSNEQRLEDDPDDSDNPAVASSNGKVYVIWCDDRCDPDTDICGGVYFTRHDQEVGIKDEKKIIIPDEYSLHVYPNPFNSSVTLSLDIVNDSEIALAIYDVNGRLVKTIFKGGRQEKGVHKYTWDAVDASGNKVSSGIYFLKAETPEISKAIKVLYLR